MNTSLSTDFKTHLPRPINPPGTQLSSPPPITSLLKKCSHPRGFQQLHAQIIKTPSHQTHLLLAKLLEAMVTSSQIDYARKVFDEMTDLSTFTFNTMIRGHALTGAGHEGILLYTRMRHSGTEPDSFTYPFLLKACNSLAQGKWVHSLILKNSNLGLNVYSQTSLISFYSNLGDLESARLAFEKMPERNVVSWTAMMTAYVKQKRYADGLTLFRRMQRLEIEPNEMTLANLLSACANLGAYEMGDWAHRYIKRKGIAMNPTLGTALIDMYAKCGRIERATEVFDSLPERNVHTWNAMIVGLAMHGLGEEALERFSEMQTLGMEWDDVTLLGVLSACNHSGLVERGKDYFYSMETRFGIEPNVKHYGCLVDLLGRAGLLNEAYDAVRNMPIEPNGVIWGTLLNYCSDQQNIELAEAIMEHLIVLEPLNDGNYVLMSNIYASKGQWNDVAEMRKVMKDRGILKTPGCSSIEVDNIVHEFIVSCSSHPRANEIYAMLDDMSTRLGAEGYVPRTNHVLLDIAEEDKSRALCHHSEKLAIAFGLVSTSPRAVIRVVKNLRACKDCHLATKLISKIYDREIIVRDRNRFHHFKDGVCSCGDYCICFSQPEFCK